MPDAPYPTRHPRATAKAVFEAVGERLQIDPTLLNYLFGECMSEILAEAHLKGSCTVRGLGRFRLTNIAQVTAEDKPTAPMTVFERTRYITKHTPFASWRLGKRLADAKAVKREHLNAANT